MSVSAADIPGVVIVEPRVFHDARGHFFESWQLERYAEFGIARQFVQDNVSVSRRGVLRGLHFQNPNAQGKLIQVLDGEVFDVAVDIRVGSPAFGRWLGLTLSAHSARQVYIPPGLAHGFCVISESATVNYKCMDYFNAATQSTLAFDDPDLDIDWPVTSPLLSEKDQAGTRLRDLPSEVLLPFVADEMLTALP